MDWQILEDAPADMVASLPQPAVGKVVIVAAPLTLEGLAEHSGEMKYVSEEERHLAL